MLLQDLLNGIDHTCLYGHVDKDVDRIIYDSRIKTKGGMFVAIEGFKVDGHAFVNIAVENGAKVIVVQKPILIPHESVTVIQVEDTRKVMAVLANNMYANPSSQFDLVGVTGTNGKTSITYLLGQVLEDYNKKIGVIGTIENRIGKTILKSEHTTPESIDLQRLFSEMVEENVTHVLMEVSSHALELNRVDGSNFKIGIFTNLTQDHLDFHKTMENYAKSKAKLFTLCKKGILNTDSDYAALMMHEGTCEWMTYGIDHPADYKADNMKITASQTTYTLSCPEGVYEVAIPIPGKFTVYNTLAVICAARELGVPMTSLLNTLRGAKGVPGRIQSFESPKGYSVIVDYAHTPDGLENVLQAIKQFVSHHIITVFGCGGDRDNAKRPLMGEVAAKYSDKVIITSDNPRSEEPIKIIEQVEVGVKKHTETYEKIADRQEAISQALTYAVQGDVILIAGKGHEDYQILSDRIIHFDDSEIVKAFIQEEKA